MYAQAAGERAAGVATWMGTPPIPGETVTLAVGGQVIKCSPPSRYTVVAVIEHAPMAAGHVMTPAPAAL